MENEIKVFHSDITRADCKEKNHLYDLLKIEPAEPVPQRSHKHRNVTWEFTPNYDKHYIPRKGSKLKVKTVSDIRNLFETEIYSYLPKELEKQQQYLLQKIQDGSSSDNKTKSFARSLINADDNPISRSAWQMLININPEEHKHPKQFVLWNGKCIQVNGSKGGKSKFICNYDLKYKKLQIKSPLNLKKKLKSKIGLLRNSLNVKFKPGPLAKKKFLDDSHHKYQMNHIELIKLPTPALQVSPAYGTVLEPAISSFINNLPGVTGVIPQKLAECAVSVLGTIRDKTPTQIEKNCCISFNLNYQCDQNRLLMRRNVVQTTSYVDNKNDSNTNISYSKNLPTNNVESNLKSDASTMSVIKQMMDGMLNSVEISLNQDSLYSAEDESRETLADDCTEIIDTTKDKPKRKYLELDKLDVTVIKLPESSSKDYAKPCSKSFCNLGCICESLDCVFNLKQHCGVIDCMFGCKCEVSKYKDIELLDRDCSDIIPGLLNLDKEINSHLAKEEQKFHQTVIVSGGKSIVLNSRKRNCNPSTKYAEFYSNVKLKADEKMKRILTVDVKKLKCENIEPFCMVHNLYKCFCKGKFTESSIFYLPKINPTKNINNAHENSKLEHEITANETSDVKTVSRPRLRLERRSYDKTKSMPVPESNDFVDLCYENSSDSRKSLCTRTMGYTGRKYSDEYYKNTNNKIMEMEKNDHLLKKKMLKLINTAKQSPNMTKSSSESLSSDEVSNKTSLACDNVSSKTYLASNDFSNETSLTSDNVSKETSLASDDVTNKTSLASDDVTNKTSLASDDVTNKISLASDDVTNKTLNECGVNKNDPFPNIVGKFNLKVWLESTYKSYKERRKQGIIKNCLDAPKRGKASLQTWDFILSRYIERKNIFLVSKQAPFRTFLAVDEKHPIFANCINIDDIRFNDLCNYPIIIRNLVTNASDSENSFFILRGWDICWELIGSAVKVLEYNSDKQPEFKETLEADQLMIQDSFEDEADDDWTNKGAWLSQDDFMPLEEDNTCKEIEEETQQNLERSKWFVMTVENDFSEIQFYKKGFFVTYDGIQRSICLARISGKTVRLSAQARVTDKNNTHQFGIYAIPCTSECCVFIGPYEVNEPLGIEVVKAFSDSRKLSKTRGVWITTNKVDNMKVIEHPLAFLPSVSIPNEAIVTLESGNSSCRNAKQSPISDENDKQGQELSKLCTKTPEKETTKSIKPIKIRRTNGFYHLSSNNVLQKIPAPIKASNLFISKSTSLNKDPIVINNSVSLLNNSDDKMLINSSEKPNPIPLMANSKPIAEIAPQVNNSEDFNQNSSTTYMRPIAEIAPQIKITSVYSERNVHTGTEQLKKCQGSSMLILKPEEINKKALTLTAKNDTLDIEKFIETSTVCVAPQDEVFVISDVEDEEDAVSGKDVWIECWNVDNFGCIRGKMNDDKLLSFEFPGFKYTAFYTEDEAFNKINQVLSRKMYVPNNVQLQWQVKENKEDLNSKILTTRCFVKNYLLIKLREQRFKKQRSAKKVPAIRTYSRNNTSSATTSNAFPRARGEETPITNTETSDLMKGLEKKSLDLENQSTQLLNEAVNRRYEIINSLTVPDNVKAKLSDRLQNIMSMNK